MLKTGHSTKTSQNMFSLFPAQTHCSELFSDFNSQNQTQQQSRATVCFIKLPNKILEFSKTFFPKLEDKNS